MNWKLVMETIAPGALSGALAVAAGASVAANNAVYAAASTIGAIIFFAMSYRNGTKEETEK
ncbi:MAG: hypothetical protein ACTSX6_10565 [Candidatus Heimdallarchaeaceae archaeon]